MSAAASTKRILLGISLAALFTLYTSAFPASPSSLHYGASHTRQIQNQDSDSMTQGKQLLPREQDALPPCTTSNDGEHLTGGPKRQDGVTWFPQSSYCTRDNTRDISADDWIWSGDIFGNEEDEEGNYESDQGRDMSEDSDKGMRGNFPDSLEDDADEETDLSYSMTLTSTTTSQAKEDETHRDDINDNNNDDDDDYDDEQHNFIIGIQDPDGDDDSQDMYPDTRIGYDKMRERVFASLPHKYQQRPQSVQERVKISQDNIMSVLASLKARRPSYLDIF